MEYALLPYEAGKSAEAFVLGYSYQHDLAAVETGMNRTTQQIYMPQAQTGILPLEKSFFEWQGEGLNLTAWKKALTVMIFLSVLSIQWKRMLHLQSKKQIG